MNLNAKNCETAQDLRVDDTLNTPAYRAVSVHFDHVLKRPDKFRISVEYDLVDTFFFDVEDWYNHRANHYEKSITLSVEFPKNIEVLNVWQSVETEHGDTWQDIEPARLLTPQKIFWRIGKAYYGNKHHLSWTTRKIKFTVPKT
jgi:hypothetical protein